MVFWLLQPNRVEAKALPPAGTPIWTRPGSFDVAAADDKAVYLSGQRVFAAADAHTGRSLWSVPGPLEFVAQDEKALYGIESGLLLAIHKVNGAAMWAIQAGSNIWIADDKVYMNNDPNWSVWNAATGDQLFQIRIGSSQGMLLSNGIAYLSVNDPDTLVFAVNASDGKKLWNLTHDELLRSALPCADATQAVTDMQQQNGTLVLTVECSNMTNYGAVIALNALSGKKIWSVDALSDATQTFIKDGTVFILWSPLGAEFGSAQAINGSTGTSMWLKKPIALSSPFTEQGGRFLDCSGSGNTPIEARNASTGESLWLSNVACGSFSATSDRIYVDYENNPPLLGVYAIDPETGQQAWIFTDNDSLNNPVTLLHQGILYVGSWDSKSIFALNATTGQPLWNLPVSGTKGFMLNHDILYVASRTKVWAVQTGAIPPPEPPNSTSPAPTAAHSTTADIVAAMTMVSFAVGGVVGWCAKRQYQENVQDQKEGPLIQ
ncbi:MAG: PQQ-binding-like beta-propeller repeat protein [Verrucomicrobia bacterium]|nr:PQQ-binding-like beta-propeller repeat protein [Verrucomicrobiota bacterium]